MTQKLSEYEVWLLINGEDLYPFSSHGFKVAQGSLKSVIQRSTDNLFLNSGGEVFKIHQVCLLHNGLFASAMRFFGRPYRIKVEPIPQKFDLSELKRRVVLGLENYFSNTDDEESWSFATFSPSISASAIMEARSAEELYSILALPPPSECLDLF